MGRHPRTDEQSEDAFDPNKRLIGLIVIPGKCLVPVQGLRPGLTGLRAYGSMAGIDGLKDLRSILPLTTIQQAMNIGRCHKLLATYM